MVELKKYNLKYIDAFISLRNNQNIYKNGFDITPNPYTKKYATDLFLTQMKKFPAERFLLFYNNNLCGEIGVWLKEDVYRLNADIGYFVGELYWGNGIATRAIEQMCNYVFKTFDVVRIVASVFEYNKPSMRVLEKNGFILETIQKRGVVKNDKVIDNYIWVKFKNS